MYSRRQTEKDKMHDWVGMTLLMQTSPPRTQDSQSHSDWLLVLDPSASISEVETLDIPRTQDSQSQ